MIVRSTTLTEDGRRIRSRILTAGAGIMAVVLLFWIGSVVDQETVSGPAGSSFVTTERGVAAMATLLEQRGNAVERIGAARPLEGQGAASTIVVLEPGLFSSALTARLPDIVDSRNGGATVIIGGDMPDEAITTLIGEDAPDVAVGGPRVFSIVPPLRGVSGSLLTDGARHFTSVGSGSVLAGTSNQATVLEYAGTGGRVILFADIGPFTNQLIDREENAAFLVALIDTESTMYFDEFVHGFVFGEDAEAVGWLRSAPTRVQATVWLLLMVGLVALFVYARRFGPPEETERTFAPDRVLHVDAVAAILRKSGDTAPGMRPIEAMAGRLLRSRSSGATSRETLLSHAERLGLSASEASAVVDGVTDITSAYAADSALAKLSTTPQESR